MADLAGWYAISVLVLITLFGLVDRQVFILMAEPIKQSMGLSDTQLGLLQGLGVALFAAVVAYPIGWLADRTSRKYVLSACILVWSLAVVACALADSFPQLFVASALVGAGEAGLAPIVYAMIPEIVRERQRLLANSVYAVATRLGVGLAIGFCSLLIIWVEVLRPNLPAVMQAMDSWRLTFIAAAAPAPLMLVLLLSIRTRQPTTSPAQIGDIEDAAEAVTTEHETSIGQHLRKHARTVFGFYIGIGLAAFGFASIINWVPPIVARLYGETPAEAGAATGTAMLFATIIGFGVAMPLLKYLQPKFGRKLPIVAIWTATLSAAITSFVLIFTTSAMQIYILQAVQIAFVMAALMIFPTALQDISPAHLRSRVIAINAVFMIVFGAISPVTVGMISDQLSHLDNGLLIAAVSASTVGLLVSAFALWWSSGTYVATAEESMPTAAELET